MKYKIIAAGILLISCAQSTDVLEPVFTFPKELNEISAVEVTPKSDLIWTLEDSGNDNKLYAFTQDGKLVHTLTVAGADNHDWEDLASDHNGNLYIGDFGNNGNSRQDLCIYEVAAAHLGNNEAAPTQKTEFYFPEQTQFPPPDSEKYYDLEAFFVTDGTFYLFTKNRSDNSDTTSLYSVPNKPGRHAARLLDAFKTCPDFRNCAITGADMSPDGKKVALVSYSHAWIFSNFKKDNFFKGKVQQIDFANFSQKEGICFMSNSKLLVTDERKKNNGGKLYLLDLSRLKSKP